MSTSSQLTLRILAMAFTAAAIAVMLTSDQPVYVEGVPLGTARYSYSSALKFIIAADAAVCGGSVISILIILWLRHAGKPYPQNTFFYAFFYDQTLASFMLAGCAAATAVGLLGRNGQPQNFWLPICGNASKFCNKVTISITFSYLANACYGILATMAVHKIREGNKVQQGTKIEDI